jgi:hypothetical protein
MQSRNFWLSKEVFIGLAFGLAIAVPVFVFGGSKAVFVDKDANGAEDGTSGHPYHSISKALDHTKSGTDVFIAAGKYKENVTVPKGVKLIGKKKDRGAVVIEASNDAKPTITMKHETELDHLTVKGGRHGIRVLENAKAIIYEVVVRDSNRDGIHIDSASRDKKYRVSISNSVIKNNDRTGVFSEKRNILIMDSDILSNGSDGIDFAQGTKAWLQNDRFNDNRGSGAKFVLDGADIWNKKNSFRNNKREGVEISSYGVGGTVGFRKTTFVNNDRYGLAKVARTVSGTRAFGGVILDNGVNVNHFDMNTLGNTSSVLRVF